MTLKKKCQESCRKIVLKSTPNLKKENNVICMGTGKQRVTREFYLDFPVRSNDVYYYRELLHMVLEED